MKFKVGDKVKVRILNSLDEGVSPYNGEGVVEAIYSKFLPYHYSVTGIGLVRESELSPIDKDYRVDAGPKTL